MFLDWFKLNIDSSAGTKATTGIRLEGRKGLLKNRQAFVRPLMVPSALTSFFVSSHRSYCTAETTVSKQTTKKSQPKQPQVSIGVLDIRVGRILHIERHPQADTLYVEKIDVGEAEPRTIISGLVKYKTEDELKGKLVLVLCNLPPKEMRGISSNGMLLAAAKQIGESGETKVEIIEPPQNATAGEKLVFEGEYQEVIPAISGNRLDKILKRCKIDENGLPVFTSGDGRVVPFTTSAGACQSKLTDATIS
jgi:methionine--tRNA ligase beta chain